jgi:hypothetical protein
VFKEKPIEQVDSDKHKLVHGWWLMRPGSWVTALT